MMSRREQNLKIDLICAKVVSNDTVLVDLKALSLIINQLTFFLKERFIDLRQKIRRENE